MGGSMMSGAQHGKPLGVVATSVGATVDVMKVDEAARASPRHRAPAMMPTFYGTTDSWRDALRGAAWALVHTTKMLGVALRQPASVTRVDVRGSTLLPCSGRRFGDLGLEGTGTVCDIP
jgi:hypothetical protein